MYIDNRKIDLSDFKLIEFSGFKYFKNVRVHFGLISALGQVSPIIYLISNIKSVKFN